MAMIKHGVKFVESSLGLGLILGLELGLELGLRLGFWWEWG